MPIQLVRDGDTVNLSDVDLIGKDGDKDTLYTIRKLTTEKHREIFRRHTKRATRNREEQVDTMSAQDDTLDYVLVDWKGVEDKGQPVECSRENKLALDAVRKMALIDRAGMAEIRAAEDARRESFRSAS